MLRRGVVLLTLVVFAVVPMDASWVVNATVPGIMDRALARFGGVALRGALATI